jgi:hypothetical protein
MNYIFAHFLFIAILLTYALLLPNQFLHQLMESPTPMQDCCMLDLDDSQMQVFCKLQSKPREILLAIKALATA